MTMRARVHGGATLTCALLLAGVGVAGQAPEPEPGEATFRVQRDGAVIGTTTVSLERTAGGWMLQGRGRLDDSLDLTLRRVRVIYDSDWAPIGATLDLVSGGASMVVHGGFAGSRSSVEFVRPEQVELLTVAVSPDALILPRLAFGAYEALAARLQTAVPGTTLRAYVLPEREVLLSLDAVGDAVVRTTGGEVAVRRWRVTFRNPAGAVPADVWVVRGRLLRLDLPAQFLSVVRSDVLVD